MEVPAVEAEAHGKGSDYMICPNCQRENKNTNIRCEYCQTQLIDVQEHLKKNANYTEPIVIDLGATSQTPEQQAKNTNLSCCIMSFIIMMFIGPFLLVGLAFLGIGTYCYIEEQKAIETYVETTGELYNFERCTYNDGEELCTPVYLYEVDGQIYTASPSSSSTKDNFSQKETVYYNPNDPSENLIKADWHTLIIVGGVFSIVPIAIIATIAFTYKNKKRK